MNPEIKAKWVAALRSGKYAQTAGCLRNVKGHCCLGVLCEVSKAETGFGIPENMYQTDDIDHLGRTVRNWAGLHSPMGDVVEIHGATHHLASHNDDGRTFSEIADAIEAQL